MIKRCIVTPLIRDTFSYLLIKSALYFLTRWRQILSKWGEGCLKSCIEYKKKLRRFVDLELMSSIFALSVNYKKKKSRLFCLDCRIFWLDVENWANKLQEKYVLTCFEGLWEDFCVELNPIRGNNKVIKAVSPQNDDSAAFSQTEQEMFSQHETFLMRCERNLFFQWRKGKKKEGEIFIHLALVLHNVNIKSKEFLNV